MGLVARIDPKGKGERNAITTVVSPGVGIVNVGVPTGEMWIIQNIYSDMTMDSTVVTRKQLINFSDGTQFVASAASQISMVADGDYLNQWSLGVQQIAQTLASGKIQSVDAMPELQLYPGSLIQLTTETIQAGDAFNQFTIDYLKFRI